MPIISPEAVTRRQHWIQRIESHGQDFVADTRLLADALVDELSTSGNDGLRDHPRLCGSIPEGYGHDSTAEKLYSKYTDHLVSLAFQCLGINSHVLAERADAADVECAAPDYNFVADAKVFRLSRTAKNAKDFKVVAMHSWKRGAKHAMVVAPLYQLPVRASQIYEQAMLHDVCVFSFSHLSLLTAYADKTSPEDARELLKRQFQVVSTLNSTKDALTYWMAINRTMLEPGDVIADFWNDEKTAASEALLIAKEEALNYLTLERRRLLELSRQAAIDELLYLKKLDSRTQTISALADNGLMGVV